MKKGDQITVAVGLATFPTPDRPGILRWFFRRGTFRSCVRGRITFTYEYSQANASGTGTDTIAYSARGIKWARGWEGEEVEALKVAVALR